MAKGRALHPHARRRLGCLRRPPTRTLRGEVEAINDRRAAEKLAAIEKSEGRKARYHVQAR